MLFNNAEKPCAAPVPPNDQLTVLTAVTDEGCLAPAARRLGRAPSAVSYAIDNLEAQLGLKWRWRWM